MKTVRLTEENIEDIKSALSFFIREYENRTKDRAPVTVKAMEALLKKLWKIK